MYDSPDDSLTRSIPEHLERLAARRGDHLALSDGAVNWSYADLAAMVGRFAREMLDHWGPGNKPVGLLFGHEPTAVAAILAVLRAGKAYVALDPLAPPNRNRALLDSVECRYILTDPVHRSRAEAVAGSAYSVLVVTAASGGPPPVLTEAMPTPDAAAAIYFTSGSTGTPKGIRRNHADLLRRVRLDVETFDYRPDDIFSFLYGYNNSGSIPDLFDPLLTGATLCYYDVRQAGLGPLAQWLNRNRVSVLHLNATLLRILLDHLPASAFFPHLRLIRPSQRLFAADVQRLWSFLTPDALVAHQYASTETGPATLMAIYRHTQMDSEIVPLGRPLPGVEIAVVDDTGRPANAGTIGEIVIRTPYLAPALRPDGDRAFFHTGDLGRTRPDGLLEMVGRGDSLVKVRGFQVSLPAIEAALLRLDVVGEAVVVARPDPAGDRVPVAFVVPRTASTDLIPALRQHLAEEIPPYALPARFVCLDRLPRLSNGKVDYQSLPALDHSRPDLVTPYTPPRTPFEELLAGIWSDVLGITSVGVHDNFLELGGHSLMAAMIASRVIHSLNIDISPPLLLQAPTVAEMAEVMVEQATRKLGHRELKALLATLEIMDNRP
jgi:acyl-coenzyme A synthetase/AMP-(fatty) acid ligase